MCLWEVTWRVEVKLDGSRTAVTVVLELGHRSVTRPQNPSKICHVYKIVIIHIVSEFWLNKVPRILHRLGVKRIVKFSQRDQTQIADNESHRKYREFTGNLLIAVFRKVAIIMSCHVTSALFLELNHATQIIAMFWILFFSNWFDHIETIEQKQLLTVAV